MGKEHRNTIRTSSDNLAIRLRPLYGIGCLTVVSNCRGYTSITVSTDFIFMFCSLWSAENNQEDMINCKAIIFFNVLKDYEKRSL
jgi:hypothetical protein